MRRTATIRELSTETPSDCPETHYNDVMPLTIGDMTDEQFAELVSEHPDLRFETTAAGELIAVPPNFTKSGFRNQEIGLQLGLWPKQDGRGHAGDASTGYVLPNGARRGPDASWVLKRRIAELDPYSQEHYFPLCPDFVIELRSQTDRLPTLRAKMHEYMDNAAQLGWLIDPEHRAVEIFRPNHEPQIRDDATTIEGEGPIAGFVLDLQPVWEPFAE